MRAVVQRVTHGQVDVDHTPVGKIGVGLVILLGIHIDDDQADSAWLSQKITHLRIFEDSEGKMNQSVLDVGGNLLVISQFTLYGNPHGGRRPDFTQAARPDKGEALYTHFVDLLRPTFPKVQTGRFGAKMSVSLTNDGPVTLVIDSPQSKG